MMFETAILVLLYNKEIDESETLKSLLRSTVQYSNAKIIIWNNGPSALKNKVTKSIEALGYEVQIEETLGNESLAVIYNQFLSNNHAKKYILLDDDSAISERYISASSICSDNVIGMPIITSFGKVKNPKIDNQSYSSNIKSSLQSDIKTIGSGLVIGSKIIEDFNRYYESVFDERFYLYGVDSTFCIRLNRIGLNAKIKFIAGFEHSLSRLNTESLKVKNFRRLERSYDVGLTYRYYTPYIKGTIKMMKVLLITLNKMLKNQPPAIYIFHMFKAFIIGKHYRNTDT